MKRALDDGQRQGRISIASIVLLVVLLLLPAGAILRLHGVFDLRVVSGCTFLTSTITYFMYWHDKRSALSGTWRTPESTLHFAELLGGWPGAFIAQRAFRHKISKLSYQVKFWTIIVLHEFAALDFIRDWQYSKKVLSLLHQ